MMNNNIHRIGRQVLELEIGLTEQALELQEIVARLFQEQSLAAMESVFDQFVKHNQVIRLEQLEVDLGKLQGNDWRQQFNSRLVEQLQHQLEQVLHSLTATTPDSFTVDSIEEEPFQQLLFFCQYGRLPWWGSKAADRWLENLQTTMTSMQWQKLTRLLTQDAKAFQRLVYTANDDFLQTIPQILYGVSDAARVQVLMSEDLPYPLQALWRERFWGAVLQYFAVATTLSEAGIKLLRHLLIERQNLYKAEFTDTVIDIDADTGTPHSVEPLHNLPPLPQPWQTWLEQAIQSLHSDSVILVPSPDGTTAQPITDANCLQSKTFQMSSQAQLQQNDLSLSNHIHITPQQINNIPGEQPISDIFDSTGSTSVHSQVNQNSSFQSSNQHVFSADLGSSIYIAGAGIVIVHPFLQELFQSLNLLDDQQQFHNRQTHRRAVALLSYLTYGNANAPEYDLLLPKWLCAWAWEEPLAPYELTNVEQNASEELLTAVLKHWSALRSNSTEWLRQQFFLRDGTMKPVDFGWCLTVEHRAQDVLLNKLPWGLGLIHFPWMNDLLHVDWT